MTAARDWANGLYSNERRWTGRRMCASNATIVAAARQNNVGVIRRALRGTLLQPKWSATLRKKPTLRWRKNIASSSTKTRQPHALAGAPAASFHFMDRCELYLGKRVTNNDCLCSRGKLLCRCFEGGALHKPVQRTFAARPSAVARHRSEGGGGDDGTGVSLCGVSGTLLNDVRRPHVAS